MGVSRLDTNVCQKRRTIRDKSSQCSWRLCLLRSPWNNGLATNQRVDGDPVKAEIGMTVQKLDSFYTFHTHDATEIYYSIKKPQCADEVEVFAMREGNPLIRTIKKKKNYRIIEFDANSPAIKDHFWLSSSPLEHDLTYYHENTIHALKASDECSKIPKKSGAVAVGARPSGFDSRNPN